MGGSGDDQPLALDAILGGQWTYESSNAVLKVAVHGTGMLLDLEDESHAVVVVRTTLAQTHGSNQSAVALLDETDGRLLAWTLPCSTTPAQPGCADHYFLSFEGHGMVGTLGLNLAPGTNVTQTILSGGTHHQQTLTAVLDTDGCMVTESRLSTASIGIPVALKAPRAAQYCGRAFPESMLLGERFDLTSYRPGSEVLAPWTPDTTDPPAFVLRMGAPVPVRSPGFPAGDVPEPLLPEAALDGAAGVDDRVRTFLDDHPEANLTLFAFVATDPPKGLEVLKRQLQLTDPVSGVSLFFVVTATTAGNETVFEVGEHRNLTAPTPMTFPARLVPAGDAYGHCPLVGHEAYAGLRMTRTFQGPLDGESTPIADGAVVYRLLFDGPVVGQGFQLLYECQVQAETGVLLSLSASLDLMAVRAPPQAFGTGASA